jgi:hypothetical protein
MADRLAFDRFAIAPSVRTAIVAAADCVRVVLEQDDQVNAAKIWDAAAAGSYKTLPAGGELIIEASPQSTTDNPHAVRRGFFKAGDTVCYVEAVGGVGPIVGSFAR